MVFANSHIEFSQLLILTLWIICIPFLREMSLMQMLISLWCFEELLAVIFLWVELFLISDKWCPPRKNTAPLLAAPSQKYFPPSQKMLSRGSKNHKTSLVGWICKFTLFNRCWKRGGGEGAARKKPRGRGLNFWHLLESKSQLIIGKKSRGKCLVL